MASKDGGDLPASQLPDSVLQCVYSYWSRLRGGRAAPTRREIDPVEMPRNVLPDLMLTEVLRAAGTRRYRYRVVGSRIVDLAGRDPTWEYLDTALPSAFGYRDYILGLYDTLADRCLALYSRSIYVTADTGGKPAREAHRLMLPVVDPDGTVTHVLAAQVFQVHRGTLQKPFLSADDVHYGQTCRVVDG